MNRRVQVVRTCEGAYADFALSAMRVAQSFDIAIYLIVRGHDIVVDMKDYKDEWANMFQSKKYLCLVSVFRVLSNPLIIIEAEVGG